MTCFRGSKVNLRKINTSVPQGSKLSSSLFNFYITDMPRPTEPVKRVCYADDLTVCATRVKIPNLEDSKNSYPEEITAYLKDNILLISARSLLSRRSARTHTKPNSYENTHCGLTATTGRCPKILGVYVGTSIIHKHSGYVAERVSSRNNILKALAGTSWGQQKEILLMTYKVVGTSIINYAAPVQTYATQSTETSNIHRTRL